MATDDTNKYQKRILTIPNILSFFRLCLIPIIVWLYSFKQDYFMTLLVLVLSGDIALVSTPITLNFNFTM